MASRASSGMTDAASVRQAGQRVHERLSEEMDKLGADPTVIAEQAGTMSGLEWLGQWVQPEIPPPPPLAVLFGVEWVEIEPSHTSAALEPPDWMFSPLGTVWGGITATLLDTVLAGAIHTSLPAGTGYATSDLEIRYIRAMTRDTGRVIVTGTVVHSGRRHATAEGRVEAEATGKLIATGTTGCTILRPS